MTDQLQTYDRWAHAHDFGLLYEVRARGKEQPSHVLIEIIECAGGARVETITLNLDDARRLVGSLWRAIRELEKTEEHAHG